MSGPRLSRPARNERGESRREGRSSKLKTSSPRPSPPSKVGRRGRIVRSASANQSLHEVHRTSSRKRNRASKMLTAPEAQQRAPPLSLSSEERAGVRASQNHFSKTRALGAGKSQNSNRSWRPQRLANPPNPSTSKPAPSSANSRSPRRCSISTRCCSPSACPAVTATCPIRTMAGGRGPAAAFTFCAD